MNAKLPFCLETERLRLEKLELQDANYLVKLTNSPGWLRYIGVKKLQSIPDAEQYLRQGPMKSYQKNGFGLWKVSEKCEGLFMGICGFLQRDYLPHPDLGFALLPEHVGKGYALEAAKASLLYAKNQLSFRFVYALCQLENFRSLRLLSALGMQALQMVKTEGMKEELLLLGYSFYQEPFQDLSPSLSSSSK